MFDKIKSLKAPNKIEKFGGYVSNEAHIKKSTSSFKERPTILNY